MAKFEKLLTGNFDTILRRVTDGVLGGSCSGSLEDSSDFFGENCRCSVRVFERYSAFGGNRVSMSVTLFQREDGKIQLSAITAGGSQAMFFKLNTLGEESFLDTLREII